MIFTSFEIISLFICHVKLSLWTYIVLRFCSCCPSCSEPPQTTSNNNDPLSWSRTSVIWSGLAGDGGACSLRPQPGRLCRSTPTTAVAWLADWLPSAWGSPGCASFLPAWRLPSRRLEEAASASRPRDRHTCRQPRSPSRFKGRNRESISNSASSPAEVPSANRSCIYLRHTTRCFDTCIHTVKCSHNQANRHTCHLTVTMAFVW